MPRALALTAANVTRTHAINLASIGATGQGLRKRGHRLKCWLRQLVTTDSWSRRDRDIGDQDTTRTRLDRPGHGDLTRADDERNVNSFVSGDQSPHSMLGFRPAWSTLRARRSKSTSGKHPITGTVEEGRSRRETA
jgi:hypothetical protein